MVICTRTYLTLAFLHVLRGPLTTSKSTARLATSVVLNDVALQIIKAQYSQLGKVKPAVKEVPEPVINSAINCRA